MGGLPAHPVNEAFAVLATRELEVAARELAQAISEIRRCECGRLTRQWRCPDCGEEGLFAEIEESS